MNTVFPTQNIEVLTQRPSTSLKNWRTRVLRCCKSTTAKRTIKKWTGSVGAERSTDPATSRAFANILTKVAPDKQSLRVFSPGDEVSLIKLTLEVTKTLSLRTLVDCGASNNFVRRQSLEAGSFSFVEREIPSNEHDGASSDMRIDHCEETCSRNPLHVGGRTVR